MNRLNLDFQNAFVPIYDADAIKGRSMLQPVLHQQVDNPASQTERTGLPDPKQLLIVQGWYSLQHTVNGHSQRLTILRGRPDGPMPQRLTPREFQIARLAALGFGSKRVATELHMQPGPVRAVLSRVLGKLDLRGCTQLPAFWHCLSRADRCLEPDSNAQPLVLESALELQEPSEGLSNAEQAVLRSVLAGLNNIEIAKQRGTSARTVANQLATLFRKFRVSSKGELAAKALGMETRVRSVARG